MQLQLGSHIDQFLAAGYHAPAERENNALIAVPYDIFGSGSTLNFLFIRYPPLRNFFMFKPLALLRFHLESPQVAE